MKYSAVCTLDINNSFVSTFIKPVAVTQYTDTIGRSFACELVDDFVKQFRNNLTEEQLDLLVGDFETADSIHSHMLVKIYYTNASDVPAGGSMELVMTQAIVAYDVANLLCEKIKKIKQIPISK